MKNFGVHKKFDNFIFALALAILIIALLHAVSRWVAREPEPVIISIVFAQWWQEDLEDDILLSLIEEFENQHEGIEIILNQVSFEDQRLALFNPVEYDEYDEPQAPPADVLALDPLWVPGLLAKGVIENAEVPFLSFINVLFYNIEILRQAGLVRPPNTRGEFLTFSRAVASAGAAYALGFGLGGDISRGVHDDIYPWIWGAGLRLINNRNPVVTSAPVVQSLAFLASLHNEGLIASNAFSADSEEKLEDFIAGRTAFMVAPTRYIATVRERMGSAAFGITSIPMLDNQTTSPFLASAGWTVGIHSASPHSEEAQLFASFFAGRSRRIAESARGSIPDAPSLDPFYANIWEITLTGEVAHDFSGLAGEHLLEEIFREELQALFAGTSSPAETAATIQARWLSVLAE